MNNKEANLVIFALILSCFLGICMGSYYQSFSIPTAKIWESNRTYDHILLADTVICNPINEINTTYWQYDVVNYNMTDYIYAKEQIDNTSVKQIIVCK